MVCEPRIIYLSFKGGFKVLFCFVLFVLMLNVKDQIPGQSEDRYTINIQ